MLEAFRGSHRGGQSPGSICKEWGEGSIGGSAQLSSLICTGNTEHGNPPGSPPTSHCRGNPLVKPGSRENIQDVSGFTDISGDAFDSVFWDVKKVKNGDMI